MRKTFENHWLVLGLIFCALIISKSMLIQFFPSPWIFSDEQSYFGMAQKILSINFENIKNSHAPGYSLIISPALMLPSVAQAHFASMIINIVVTSVSVLLAYLVFHKKFNIPKITSILYSSMVAILPQFILFNYILMSEAVAITLIYTIFVLMLLLSDGRWKRNVWIWMGLGIGVGFAPIVRSQYLVLIVLFSLYCIIELFRNKNAKDRWLLVVSFSSAILTYSFFRFFLFPSIGLYSELRGSYVQSLLKAVSDPYLFFDLIHILTGELSFYFVATLFVPTFIAILFTYEKLGDQKYRNVIVFWAIFIIINTAITTVHANFIMHKTGAKTIYARYLDHIIPIIFTIGLAGVHKYKELVVMRDSKKFYTLAAFSLVAISLCFLAGKNIFANTFTIYIYQYIGESKSKIIFILVAIAFLYLLARGNRKIVNVGIGLCLLASVVPAIDNQKKFSRNTFNYYAPIGRWFDDNRVEGADIRIDTNVVAFRKLKADQPYPKSGNFTYTYFYSTLFWVNYLKNKIGIGEVNLDQPAYFITDRLLPRKILARSGPFALYDKEIRSSIELDASMLSRFGSGLKKPEVDWVWMDSEGRMLLDMNKALVPEANRIDVEIQLKGFYPSTLDKMIEVLLNGESLGTITGRDNLFHFSINKAYPLVVTEMVINAKTWDPVTKKYAQDGKGLGLDLKNVRLDFFD